MDLSESGIFSSNGDLLINIQSDAPRIATIYLPMAEKDVVKFDVRIDKFKPTQNGNLAFGFGGEECKITDGEFIFYRSANSVLYVVSGVSALEFGDTLEKYTLGSTDSLEFRLNKLNFEIYHNDIIAKTGIVSVSKPTFCISYRFPEYVDLTSVISNFSIEKEE